MKRKKITKGICYPLSYIVGIGVPLWAILEKCLVWAKEYRPVKSAGLGIMLIAIVVAAVGRRVIVPAISKYLGWLAGWLGLAFGAGLLGGVAAWLYTSLEVLRDIATVCVACCIGFLLAAAIAAIGKIIGEKEVDIDEP